jgi:aminoglycoside phosphotransferase (APT) family kinase protein
VKRLLRAQFPAWADLDVVRVVSDGTDNAIYRIGEHLAARLPRIEWAKGQVAKEARWLPELAPRLPLPISAPAAVGEPGEGYPWQWCIAPWFEGRDATPSHLDDLVAAAKELGAFVRALQSIDAGAGPPAGRHNFYRGVPLAVLDEQVRRQIPEWERDFDTAAITSAWEAALAAPAWEGPRVWLHGDLLPVNIIANGGRLAAVIDFGCLGVGDPAADLIAAWALFEGESRAVFREAVGVDAATWARGRGWALRAVGALPYYRETNPGIVARCRHQIAQVLADQA